MIRWIGAGLILLSCGGFGFSMAAEHCREEKTLKQLLQALELMECELQYRLSSLPELCRVASESCVGLIAKVLTDLSLELEQCRFSDPSQCMDKVLLKYAALPQSARRLLTLLGHSIGKFDLEGQVRGIGHVKQECTDMLSRLTTDRDTRIRNYRTLGLCAGAALAILLL